MEGRHEVVGAGGHVLFHIFFDSVGAAGDDAESRAGATAGAVLQTSGIGASLLHFRRLQLGIQVPPRLPVGLVGGAHPSVFTLKLGQPSFLNFQSPRDPQIPFVIFPGGRRNFDRLFVGFRDDQMVDQADLGLLALGG